MMLPQSAEDESASYRLGHALTVPWTATCPRTDRDPSYRGRNKRKSTLGAISCDESALTSCTVSHCAVSLPRYCSQCRLFVFHIPFPITKRPETRNTWLSTRAYARYHASWNCSFNNSAVISFTTKSGRNIHREYKKSLIILRNLKYKTQTWLYFVR